MRLNRMFLRQKALEQIIIVTCFDELNLMGMPIDKADAVYIDSPDVPERWLEIFNATSKAVYQCEGIPDVMQKVLGRPDIVVK